jgi:hypothetical protein
MAQLVARWYIFIPKIQIWVNFGGPWNGKCYQYLMAILRIFYIRQFGKFYGQVVYFVIVWYIFQFWYVLPKKYGNPGLKAVILKIKNKPNGIFEYRFTMTKRVLLLQLPGRSCGSAEK